ncbi:MAG TPA: PQQ-binding-like beta-propeller repeat protein [Pseudonocardiaceae bacterium]|nr:PQQ-binding-like beta-propeller repeat protein [Pseudonocardiaceae bacterium]
MPHTPSRNRKRRLRIALVLMSAVVLGSALLTGAARGDDTGYGDWASWSKDLAGSRYAADESRITAADVSGLTLKWAFQLPRIPNQMGKSQPVVVGGTLYVGSTDGKFYALDAHTGATRWVFDATTVAGPNTQFDTDSLWDGPVVHDDRVFFGDHRGFLYSLDRTTGALRWATLLDGHPMRNLTGSPVYYHGRIYIGVSSQESGQGATYPCCTFRGSVLAVDADTGAIAWRYYTIPQPQRVGTWPNGVPEYAPSGGAVWGTPAIDSRTDTLYVGTGQNYSGSGGDIDSILALSAVDGSVRWKHQFVNADTWRYTCWDPTAVAGGFCPGATSFTALDYDIGYAPNMFSVHGRQLVGFGQKTGVYHVYDAVTGQVVWEDQLGHPVPSGGSGGIRWGGSYDGQKLYVATYQAGPGTLFALEPGTGDIIWQTPNPSNGCAWGGASAYPSLCQLALTPAVTSSPGVVYEGSADGKFRVFSADTGQVLWEYDTVRDFAAVNGPGRGSAMSGNGGAVVANGMVYVQSGYYPFYPSSPDKGYVLLAFGL